MTGTIKHKVYVLVLYSIFGTWYLYTIDLAPIVTLLLILVLWCFEIAWKWIEAECKDISSPGKFWGHWIFV